MTELDPAHIIKDKDCIYYRGEKYQKVKEPPRMYFENEGVFQIVSYNGKIYYRTETSVTPIWWVVSYNTDNERILEMVTDAETEELLEGIYFNDVRKGHYDDVDDEPYCPDDPPEYDEVEWDEKDNLKPAEEVFDRLENKYKKYGGTSYMTDEVIDRVMEKWKTDPPEFLKFEMGKTMEQLVERWWQDVFIGINSHWDMKTAIDDLVDRIQLWLPREQSAEGSQNVDTMLLVDGFNDCLNKIKSKLRNKE